jgi:IS66 Orf2 like protein
LRSSRRLSVGDAGARREAAAGCGVAGGWCQRIGDCAGSGDSSRAAVWLAAAAAGSAATGFCAGTDCAGGADLCVQPGNDRDRVCRRGADADHGRGRRGDADGCGRGAGEWTAAMIPIASGVRVWIATGHTDMRRGMNSLALLVQEAFKRDPHAGGSLRV